MKLRYFLKNKTTKVINTCQLMKCYYTFTDTQVFIMTNKHKMCLNYKEWIQGRVREDLSGIEGGESRVTFDILFSIQSKYTTAREERRQVGGV